MKTGPVVADCARPEKTEFSVSEIGPFPANVFGSRGDQMTNCPKIAPKEAQPIFRQKSCITF
jgi:hypothetical protein